LGDRYDKADNEVFVLIVFNLFSGSSARLDFHLNAYTDATSLAAAIRSLAYGSGSTYMGLGLQMARTQTFNAANGDRPDVPNVIILVTDGSPTDRSLVLNEVSIIKSLGIRIVGVGVTNSVSN